MSDVVIDRLRIGAVVSRSFSIIYRNIVPFGAVALLLNAPLSLYIFFVEPQLITGEIGNPWSYAVIVILSFGIAYYVMATLIIATERVLSGNSYSTGECMFRGLRVFAPVFAVGILATVSIVIGLALLIVPGLFVMVYTVAVVAVAAIEQPGILKCFSRSGALTKGNRWRVFAVLLILLAVYILLKVVVDSISLGTPFATEPIDFDSFGQGKVVIAIVFQWVFGALGIVIWSVMAAVLYHDLRVARDGPNDEEIAAVFE